MKSCEELTIEIVGECLEVATAVYIFLWLLLRDLPSLRVHHFGTLGSVNALLVDMVLYASKLRSLIYESVSV